MDKLFDFLREQVSCVDHVCMYAPVVCMCAFVIQHVPADCQCELDTTASFCDLGSGMGRPCFHAAAMVPHIRMVSACGCGCTQLGV